MKICPLFCIAWFRLKQYCNTKYNKVHRQPRESDAQEKAGRSRQVPREADELVAFVEGPSSPVGGRGQRKHAVGANLAFVAPAHNVSVA
jgi:hypothetical protein